MYYTKVIYNAEAWGKLAYCFKVNMLCREVEITYDNFFWWFTTKGIKLNRKQYFHLKQLLKIEYFKKFRNNMNMDTCISLLDPYSWKLQCMSNDGNPILEIPDGGGDDIMHQIL